MSLRRPGKRSRLGGVLHSLRKRWRAWRRLREGVCLWSHPQYELHGIGQSERARGMTAERARRIVGRLAGERLICRGDLRRPRPASYRDLVRFHSPTYLASTADPETLGSIFGLPPEAVDVDALLSASRRATGGTIAAAAAVGLGPWQVGVNLGGGFHHAEPELGGGFCIFNDVAVAIERLRSAGYSLPIAVVDLDYHQGNGNIVGFSEDESVLTCSLHGAVWTHTTAVSDLGVLLPTGTGDDAYLAALRQTLRPALAAHRPGLVFYIAGNDVLAGDRLGDFRLTVPGVLARDRHVVDCVREVGARLVVTLGGGYGPHAWECSANLVRWLLTDDARIDARPREDLRARFSRIAESIDPIDLQRPGRDSWELTEEDVLGELAGQRRSQRVLGYYSAHGIEFALGRYGVLDQVRSRGFSKLEVSVDPADPSRQSVRVFGQKGAGDAVPRHLLVELVLRLRSVPPPPGWDLDDPVRLLWVEWLLLQDPTGSFSLDRPPLPGQDHPGLGVSRHIVELLVQACRRLELDGLGNCPAHYHNAAGAPPEARFLDPEVQGRFVAMREVLAGLGLHDASRSVLDGRVRLGAGTVVPWFPTTHVIPISERLREWVASEEYAGRRDEAASRTHDEGLHLV